MAIDHKTGIDAKDEVTKFAFGCEVKIKDILPQYKIAQEYDPEFISSVTPGIRKRIKMIYEQFLGCFSEEEMADLALLENELIP